MIRSQHERSYLRTNARNKIDVFPAVVILGRLTRIIYIPPHEEIDALLLTLRVTLNATTRASLI